ncbi:MAG: class II aldolase/adducin family protein, partial [Solirubrobacteraceae bacterium]
ELALHLGAYRRFQAGAVVHAHSPVGTALACVLDELPLIHYQMLALGGPIRVAPYATFGTPELAQLTLDALDGRAAALMANHGMLAIGPDLKAAVENAELLEWACELYWRAAAVGRPRMLDAAQAQEFIDAIAARNYGELQERDG